MSPFEPLTRRAFIRDLGLGTLGLVVFGGAVAACSSESEDGGGSAGEKLAGVTWSRVDLGIVSAYVLVRGSEAALVDTGLRDSEGGIEAALAAIGLGWANVGDVIVTHSHPDHLGSVGEVMELASNAQAFAGEGDLQSIESFAPRPVTAVGDDDTVFGLEVIETPGHTAGHISVLDPVGGLLVAGDALTGENGTVAGPTRSTTNNSTLAAESIRKLAELTFDTVVFGHGDPVVGGADAAVASLASSL